MSHPRQHRGGRPQHPDHGGYYDEHAGGEALDYSNRTPSSRGMQSQHTERYTQYTGYTDGLGGSDRTPYSQHTGYYTGAYTQGSHTVNDSGRTPYSEGNYTERGGALNQSGRTSNYYTYASGTSYGESDHYGTSAGTSYGQDGHSVRSRRQPSSQQYMNSTQQHQYDGSSVCPSVGATTVADGGRGRCPYQIEFGVQNQGKQLSATKRLIHFRFGYANAAAMSQGKTGTDCRGVEHDIVVSWSITGGKRSISLDGREIQYSAGKRGNASRRADVLEAAFRVMDHTYELRCFAYKPAAGSPEKRDPRWRQYQLMVDGRSFFELPQIFDLGLKGLVGPMASNPPSQVFSNAHSSMSGISDSHASSNPAEVKNAIQARIDRQRQLMKSRKNEVAAEKRRNRAEAGNGKSGTSLASDLQSMGLESAGLESAVHSAAPSELDEMKNRRAAPAAEPKMNTEQRVLTEYTPAVKPSAGASRPPEPRQPQIQAHQRHMPPRQDQNHQLDTFRSQPQLQPQHQSAMHSQPPNYQLQVQQHTQQQPQYPPASRPPQLQIEAQPTQNRQIANTAQQQTQNINHGRQVEQSRLEYVPQQPPTLQEIRRSLAPDRSGGESVASSLAPRQGEISTGANDPDNCVGDGNLVSASTTSRGSGKSTPSSRVNKWAYF